MNSAQKELSTKSAALVKSRNHLLEVLTSLENSGSEEGIYQGRSNPNRETEAYLLLDGRLNLTERHKEDLCSRFITFNTVYKECLERYTTRNNLNSSINSSEVERIERIDSIAVQYALGVLLSDFHLKLHGIIAQGTGIAVAAVLTGVITIDQALEGHMDLCVTENPENACCSEKNPNAVFLNCPIMTPVEVVKSLKGFVNPKQVVIYPGQINKLENLAFYDEKLFTWVEMNINDQPIESIIRAFAKLYPLGVKYNPNKFFAGKEQKVALPTYPFENETYKVSFQEELTNHDLASASLEQKKLLKPDSYYSLSDSERRSCRDELANDLKKFAI